MAVLRFGGGTTVVGHDGDMHEAPDMSVPVWIAFAGR